MKSLLVTAIICQTFVLGLVVGYSHLLYKQQVRSDQCIREILDKDVVIHDYFGHKVDMSNIWIHAQAAVSNQYLFCMNRREK